MAVEESLKLGGKSTTSHGRGLAGSYPIPQRIRVAGTESEGREAEKGTGSRHASGRLHAFRRGGEEPSQMPTASGGSWDWFSVPWSQLKA